MDKLEGHIAAIQMAIIDNPGSAGADGDVRSMDPPCGAVHAAGSEPGMLGLEVINKKSAGDPSLKELKQLVEGGVSNDAEDWPRHLRDFHVKHADYTVMDNTVLVDGKPPSGAKKQDALSPPQEPRRH